MPPSLAPMSGLSREVLELTGLQKWGHPELLRFGVELLLLVLFFASARWLVTRLTRRIGDQLVERHRAVGDTTLAARTHTLAEMLQSTAQFIVGFVFLISLLALLGVNITAIVGTASVAGLAFGFGAQKLVKDVITGYFLLLEDQYAVGDVVTVGAITGTVEEISMRITRIRDDDGRLFILSNGDIAQVCNLSRGPIRGHFELGIAAVEDPDRAREVLEAALAAQVKPLGLQESPQVEGVAGADAAKTTLRIAFKVAPGQRPDPTALVLRRAAREALIAAGIGVA